MSQKNIRPKAEYAKAKLNQFMSVVNSEEAKTQGLLPTLKQYGFKHSNINSLNCFKKSRALIISSGGYNLAQITVVL